MPTSGMLGSSRILHGCLAGWLLCTGCAYPRRSTPLSSVRPEIVKAQDIPDHLWRFELLAATVPDKPRSGLSWDEDGGPDPYLVLFLDGRAVWQSPVAENTLRPLFSAGPEKNLAFDRNRARMRLELWDKDRLGADPIGVYEGKALADVILGSESLLKLEGGATVSIRLAPPVPHLGTGIALYELRKHELVVLDVWPSSPAARAGIRAGDRIVAIDGQTIAALGPERAESRLSLAIESQAELTVQKGHAQRRVRLDKGYVWLSM